jgi:flagellar hook protein FlgE
MSFSTGLSGLRAANQDLSTTGNNIANASTTGFKKSRTEFGDVYANSILGTSSRSSGNGVLVSQISQQFQQGNISITNNSLDLAVNGSGFFILNDQGKSEYTRAGNFSLDNLGYVVSSSSARLQGFAANSTGNILSGALSDLRIQTSDITPKATTELNLKFNLDSTSAVPAKAPGRPASVAGTALPLSAFPVPAGTSFNIDLDGAATTITLPAGLADATALATEINTQLGGGALNGLVSASNVLGSIVLTQQGANGGEVMAVSDASSGADLTNVFGSAAPTTTAGLVLDPSDPNSYNWSTAATVYDSLGSPHTLTSFYVKNTPTPAAPPAAAFTGWSVYTSLDDAPPHSLGTVSFNTNGALIGTGALPDTWAMGNTGTDDLVFQIDVAGSSQFGSDFTVNALDQNGYAAGRLASVDIGDTGVVFARYTNGQALALGQVALANFANPQGLVPVGNTDWAESFDSGQPVIGAPQTGARGSLQSGALEDSNVDISDELVNLILAQRNYQANAKTIETNNAVTQTILNLR